MIQHWFRYLTSKPYRAATKTARVANKLSKSLKCCAKAFDKSGAEITRLAVLLAANGSVIKKEKAAIKQAN